MKHPNFFIAGAPRCGTTALYTYLSEHPRIFMPEVKELHYFSDDFYNIQKIAFHSLNDYLALFEKAGDQHLAVGEASPFYMFSKTAIQNIYAYDPHVKIILTLRNPVEFVQSLHQLNFSLLRESEPSLSRAWELESLRMQGQNVPKSARHVEMLRYSELGQFGKYVEKIFSIFPREQVKIILLDDLNKDTRAVYEDILAFLEVPSDGRAEFPRINAGFENRSALMARILHPPAAIYKPALKFMSLFGGKFMKSVSVVFNRVERINTTRAKRAEIDPIFKARLIEHFAPDVQKLSNLIGRDLSSWLVDQP